MTDWDDSLPEKARQAVAKASTKKREAALKHSTEFLDTLPWKGERATSTQALAWPRQGVFRDDGAPITGIPEEVKQAAALVAGFLLAKIPFDAPAMGWVMLTVGHLLKEDADLIERNVTHH